MTPPNSTPRHRFRWTQLRHTALNSFVIPQRLSYTRLPYGGNTNMNVFRSRNFQGFHHIIIGVASALVACSAGSPTSKAINTNPNGPAAVTTAQVATQGADVALADTATVHIPAGALTDPLTIEVTVAQGPIAAPGAAASEVVRFLPHGRHFTIPATITLHYSSSTPASQLKVMRLADDNADSWKPVGGVRFANGVATFETTSFSYYTVVANYACTPQPSTPACAGACDTNSFCSNNACVSFEQTNLCDNKSLVILNGENPDLIGISPDQTPDGQAALALAGALATQCGFSPSSVSEADLGVLDPCDSAPLFGPDNTILVVGGNYTQRVIPYLNAAVSPVGEVYDATTDTYAFSSRAGTTLTQFAANTLTPSHDYFVLQIMTEPRNGALVFSVYGIGWEGTPAAVWYFLNTVQAQMAAKTRPWAHYALVEWTDDGNGVKDAADTFTVLAQDTP